MANIKFTNLNIIESGKGGLNQLFQDKSAVNQPNNTLGNIHKQVGDPGMGKNIMNDVTSNKNSFIQNNNTNFENSSKEPNKMISDANSNKNIDSKAGESIPLKGDIKAEQKPWMETTQPPPEPIIKNDSKSYEGTYSEKSENPIKDSNKSDMLADMNKNNDRSTEKQQVPDKNKYDFNHKVEPQKPKDIVGPGPKIMDTTYNSTNVNDYGMKTPNNPNPEMHNASSKPVGQVPTPNFPMNSATKRISGIKQPATNRPSIRLPRP